MRLPDHLDLAVGIFDSFLFGFHYNNILQRLPPAAPKDKHKIQIPNRTPPPSTPRSRPEAVVRLRPAENRRRAERKGAASLKTTQTAGDQNKQTIASRKERRFSAAPAEDYRKLFGRNFDFSSKNTYICPNDIANDNIQPYPSSSQPLSEGVRSMCICK